MKRKVTTAESKYSNADFIVPLMEAFLNSVVATEQMKAQKCITLGIIIAKNSYATLWHLE